ncbi:MAG: amidohydrolase family protein [bacterium]|nr:amidohydrolase family protein [bacterium]
MNETRILGNGIVMTGGGPGPTLISDGAVAWRGERIVAVGPEADLRRELPGARTLDAHGGLILPGFVNLHHHFYSALARGLDPGVEMRTFSEVLDRLWWRLDRALDAETVRLSAELSAADCIRWGATTVFDHHASPSSLAGSLELIAGAIEAAGLSAVLCYEVTDRNGRDEAAAGIEENLDFLRAHRDHPRIRGIFGLHASFTLRDETLAEVARRRPPGAGCHIHVAEDPIDVEASLRAFGRGPVERLDDAGLVDERALLAHGVHLGADSLATIACRDAVLIHHPESNANNGVGRLDPVAAAGHGCLVGLGTDGMSSAMHRALRAAFLAHRGGTGDPGCGFTVLPDLLQNNVEVARRFFAEPLLGELAPQAPADVIVLDAPPPTPIGPENFFGHLVYGASEAPVRHTIARGRVLLEDFRHTTLDPAQLAARGRELAPGLWRRFHALSYGTPFLG